MNEQVLKALEGAVLKWNGICYDATIRGSFCPLCVLYKNSDCSGCPIREAVGWQYCQGTPYKDWSKSYDRSGAYHGYATKKELAVIAELAERELIFLCSLLPKDHKWYEKFK